MKKRLEQYGFSQKVVATVNPIIESIVKDNMRAIEERICLLALDVCDQIEKKALAYKEADDYFTLIDLCMTDNYPNFKLRQEVKDILFEGMILHDYGKDYGANLHTIRIFARLVLEQKTV